MVQHISEVRLRSEADASFGSNIEVKSLRGTEALGRPYDLAVELVCRGTPPSAETVLELPLTLELKFQHDERVRRIHGIAAQVGDKLTTETDTPIISLRFVPRLWRLTLTRTTEIFMGMSVDEIIAAKLARAGLEQGKDFEMRLETSYPKKEYVVQYDESDMDFVARLAEHVGITLFFEQDDEQERVVFTDYNQGFKLIEGGGTAAFFRRGDVLGVYELESTTSTLPGQYVVKDYNYRTPQVALKAKSPIENGRVGWQYEYGAHFNSPEEADFTARIRAEEVACRRTRFAGRSTDMRFMPGVRFKLEGHPLGEPELLLTEVTHDFEQTTMLHGATGAEHGYGNSFNAVHSARPYRPERRTAKPKVYGCITAQIESAGDGPYAEIDDDGRYHVRFSFDIADGARGQATRLVRMAQPHAGAGYGFHFPLRHGVEVLITFIDGDPDRPIISAAVPNPQTPSVVGANNGTRNIIRTGAGNEINIDDTEGGERIKLSTPHGGSSFQLGAPNTPSAGAAVNTTDAWNAVAGGGTTTASTAVSTFADVASLFATANIVAFAGGPNVLSALLQKGPAIVKGAASVVDGVLDTFDNLDKVEEAKANEAAEELRDKASQERLKAGLKRASGNGGAAEHHEARAAQYDRQAEYHEANAKAVAAANKVNSDARAETKRYTKAASTAADAFKGGKDLWSLASSLTQKATSSGVAGVAATIAAVATGLASVGRIGAAISPPGAPKNIQAAANGAALIGLSTALVSGASSAACVAGGDAVLAGGAKALVKSPAQAEIAGIGRTLITSGALVDVLCGGRIQSKAGATMSHKAGAAMDLSAGAALNVKSGAHSSYKAGAGVGVSAGGAMTTKSGGKMNVKSGGNMSLKSGGPLNIKAGADLNAKASGKAALNAGGPVKVKGSVVNVKAGGTTLDLGGGAKLNSSTVNIASKGSATIKGSNVTVNASVFKAKGRCLLG